VLTKAPMRTLLDSKSVSRGLRRVADEIAERHRGAENLVLVGIRRGGVPLARALRSWVLELEGREIPLGNVDITLYRDDAATALPNPRIGPSDIPCCVQHSHVILVDDVVFTGRTVRAAIDAVLDYGRPQRIELFALIDRGGREFPIQPDYVVCNADVGESERIDVVGEGHQLEVIVQPFSAPSVSPSES
jgi:pyrimidine operon attenuation protein/uracil phosphoribosyltransferase